MSTRRAGILPLADRMAIFDAARRLKLDPYELGGFLSLESGPNMDPNIRGGAGGNYYGMIQFGPSERQKYLDPNKIGKYTRAEQMPLAVQFLLDRGFKPGEMGIDRAYATVLGGNPNVSLHAKDSFGTSVAGALPRFKPGGDLYRNAQRVLGDDPGSTASMAAPAATSTPGPTAAINPTDFLKGFLLKQLLFNEQDAAPSLSNTLLSSMLKAPEKQDLTSDFLTANLYTPRSQFLESLTQF